MGKSKKKSQVKSQDTQEEVIPSTSTLPNSSQNLNNNTTDQQPKKRRCPMTNPEDYTEEKTSINGEYFYFKGQKVQNCSKIPQSAFTYADTKHDWGYAKLGIFLNILLVYYCFYDYMWYIFGFEALYLFGPMIILIFYDHYQLKRDSKIPSMKNAKRGETKDYHGTMEFNIDTNIPSNAKNLGMMTFTSWKQTWFFTWNISINRQFNQIHQFYKTVLIKIFHIFYGGSRTINRNASYFQVMNSGMINCINNDGNLVFRDIRLPGGNGGILKKMFRPYTSKQLYKVEAILDHEREIITQVNIWETQGCRARIIGNPFQIICFLSIIQVFYAHVQIHKSAVFITKLGKAWKYSEQASIAINGLNTSVFGLEPIITGDDTGLLIVQNANRGYPHDFAQTMKLLKAKSQLYNIIMALHRDDLVREYAKKAEFSKDQQMMQAAITNCLCTHGLDHYVFSRFVPLLAQVDFLDWNGIIQSIFFANWNIDVVSSWNEPPEDDDLSNRIYSLVKQYGPDICEGYQWASCQ